MTRINRKFEHTFDPTRGQHAQHLLFIAAIHRREKVRVCFYSEQDGCNQTRLCAPLDFGPSRRSKDGCNRYHLWDYESDKKVHPLSLTTDRIRTVEVTGEVFEPGAIVTWSLMDSPWYTARDWGASS